MKKLSAVLLSFLLLAGCTAAPSAGSAYRQITAQEAVDMMHSDPDALILDVRTPEEFASGHIPNAINIPLDTIGSEPIPQLPKKDQVILVYCRSGNRSKTASQKLAEQGYTQIFEFGGIKDWPGPITE